MYDTLFSPVQIGHLTLKNRLSFAPTSMAFTMTERLAKYRAVAASGVALITIGDVSVQPAFHGFGLADEQGRAAYRAITDTIHQAGGKVSAQLFCSDYDMAAIMAQVQGQQLSHDAIKQMMNDSVGDFVTQMPTDKISALCQAFATAAIQAQAVGFDLIQIHGDRLIGSFSSCLYNQRTDRYGGSPEKRCQFAVEILQHVRAAVSLPIDYKLAVRQENPHYGNAGVLMEELPIFVPRLADAGADAFHVTLANHSALSDTIPHKNHPYFQNEGCFLYLADAVKQCTTLPVCGVGKLSSPDYIDAQLANGRVDMVAMSRQLLADDQWLAKVRAGQPATISSCLYCNKKCADALQTHAPFGCVLVPEHR